MLPEHADTCPCADCETVRDELNARWEDSRPTAEELDAWYASETPEPKENAR